MVGKMRENRLRRFERSFERRNIDGIFEKINEIRIKGNRGIWVYVKDMDIIRQNIRWHVV